MVGRLRAPDSSAPGPGTYAVSLATQERHVPTARLRPFSGSAPIAPTVRALCPPAADSAGHPTRPAAQADAQHQTQRDVAAGAPRSAAAGLQAPAASPGRKPRGPSNSLWTAASAAAAEVVGRPQAPAGGQQQRGEDGEEEGSDDEQGAAVEGEIWQALQQLPPA
jgi:hypothetical protein